MLATSDVYTGVLSYASPVSRPVGIRELRANVAEFLRRASRGERIVVTVSGSPVASLGPLGGDETADLVASGRLLAPRRTSGFRPPHAVRARAGLRVDRLLDEVRR